MSLLFHSSKIAMSILFNLNIKMWILFSLNEKVILILLNLN